MHQNNNTSNQTTTPKDTKSSDTTLSNAMIQLEFDRIEHLIKIHELKYGSRK